MSLAWPFSVTCLYWPNSMLCTVNLPAKVLTLVCLNPANCDAGLWPRERIQINQSNAQSENELFHNLI